MGQVIDVEKKHLSRLRELLNIHLTNKTVWAYGSRVKWKADKVSDLDLVVMDAEYSQVVNARDAFSESDLPFSVQLLSWEGIPDNFKENIRKKYFVLQEGNGIPEGWREVKLEEIADIIGGFAFKSKDFSDQGNALVVKIKDIRPPIIDVDNATKVHISNYNETNLNKFQIRRGDYVIAMTGATIGKIGRLVANTEALINQRVAKIESKKDIDKNFVYYAISNHDFQTFIKNNVDSHSAQANISGTSIGSYKLLLPPLHEQKAIAEILSSLDNKIDLLRRQNETLETMAQTLFRQWFVEEARDDWEEVSLGDFVQCTTGYSYRSDDLKPSKNALVTLKNFARDGSFRMDGFKEFIGDRFKPEQIIKQGDLVVSHTDITQEADIVGNPALVIAPPQYDTLVMTMDLMKVESNQEWLSKEFLYYLFKTIQFKSHCLGYSNGSTVLHMSRKTIPNFQLRLPDRDKVVAFTDSAKPSVRKIVENIGHIRTLENLRDRLLPSLMSGRIQTSNRRGEVS